MSVSGNVFFFSGNLATSMESCATQATAAGAAISEGLTAKTTHLVAGPGAEDEVATATAAGVTVISEAEFSRVFFDGGVGAAVEEAGAEALGGDFDTVTARGFVRGTPLVHSRHSSRATLSGLSPKFASSFPPPFSTPPLI